MRIIQETRDGDTSQRAGIVITDGKRILCGQPTNMVKNGWKLDVFKGHIQVGENSKEAAIRECWEESNIRFEPWKLTNPIQITYKNNPLFLFLARIVDINPDRLSCVSTFVDSSDGIRKPEVEAYLWVDPISQRHLIQDELIPAIYYYFNNILNEDCQCTGSIAGDIPPNISGTFSLGYKNGKFMPVPKKKITSQNYDSIPHF